jgi:hypothetical protein
MRQGALVPYGTRAPRDVQHHLPAYCGAGLLFPHRLPGDGGVCGDRGCVTVGPPSVPGPAVPGLTCVLARAILMASASFFLLSCWSTCSLLRVLRTSGGPWRAARPGSQRGDPEILPAPPLHCRAPTCLSCMRGSSSLPRLLDPLATRKTLTQASPHVYSRHDRFSLDRSAGILSSTPPGKLHRSAPPYRRPTHPRGGRASRTAPKPRPPRPGSPAVNPVNPLATRHLATLLERKNAVIGKVKEHRLFASLPGICERMPPRSVSPAQPARPAEPAAFAPALRGPAPSRQAR